MSRLLVIPIFWSIFLQLNGQGDIEFAKISDERNKTQDVVINEYVTNIAFSFDKKTALVTVKETGNYQFKSLKANNSVTFGIGYNDNSEITKAKSPGSNFDKVCGNYRPEWMFHSNDMLCIYSFYFDGSGETKSFIYEKNYADVHYFTTLYFSDRHPVLKRTIRFHIPDGLVIELKEFNTSEYNLKTTKSYDPKENITTIEYQCENLPGYETEYTQVPKSSFVYPHLLIIPKSYSDKNGYLPIFDNLNDLYQWSKRMVSRTSNVTTSIKPFVEKMIEGKTDDLVKIKSIYYWVQDNIRYIAFEDGAHGYIPDNAEKVFNEKYSDCKGKANLLKTMLQLAGYDARLTWVGTSDIRYDFSTPTLATCDHMVCTLLFKGKHYILDATISYLPFAQNPEYLQGKQALIENGNQFILDTIPISGINENLVYSKQHYTILNDVLHGEITIEYNGDRKQHLLQKINATRTDDRTKLFEKIITSNEPKIQVNNITTSDIQDREDTFVIKGSIMVKGNVILFEKDLYVTLEPFDDLSKLTVQDARQTPFDISVKMDRKTETVFDLPDGYTLQTIPQDLSFTNDLISFKVTYFAERNTIRYNKEIKTFEKIIPKERFREWNFALKQLKIACSQPVILKKTKL